MKVQKRLAALVLAAALSPALVQAQTGSTGAIAGVARDATGAVLPGVTVEASSPALIEKVRTAVTDDQGNYKIVDLRPGTYKVTFTLPGFGTFQRDGLELTAGFTATANAEMKVGALEETVTVTGASPVVDVQNVRTQNVLSRTVLDSVPNNKTIPAFAALTLGATVAGGNQDVGGNKGEPTVGISIHGSRSNDAKLLYDGMPFNTFNNAGGANTKSFLLNQVAVQEMALGTGGILAESETGGLQINAVPRDGGNRFSLYGNFNFANESMQGTNISDEILSRGLTSVNPIRRIYDAGVGVGGPIKRDRLWFYSSNRWWNAAEYLAGLFYNKSTNNFVYEPDTTRRVFREQPARDNGVRLTWQITAKHKLNVSDNHQKYCNCGTLLSATTAPDGSSFSVRGPNQLVQATWNYARTNRLLFDAGASFGLFGLTPQPFEGVEPTDIGITEQTTGFRWGANTPNSLHLGTSYGRQDAHPYVQRLGISYITGSHALKTGLEMLQGRQTTIGRVNESLTYTFRNGVPLQLTQWASPHEGREQLDRLALFIQDQWTVSRFTLSGGVRYDNFVGTVPAQTRPAGRFIPAISFDKVENVPNFKDITPRGGVAWDVFGDGKTAVKFSMGKYLATQGVGIAVANQGAITIGQSATRQWTDRNGNFVPDCDLASVALNGECGALTSTTFGRPVVTNRWDPDLLNGWDRRPNNVQTTASVQHELRPNVALNAGYFHTSWGNFPALVNEAVTAADFGTYCVTAPADARLPGGGGYQVCGLYDVNPNRFGQVNNLITRASNFGEYKEHYDGVDVSLTARFGRGGFATGGVSTGRTVKDTCFQNALPQIVANSAQGALDDSAVTGPRTEAYCNITPPWSANTQFKANAVYPLPWDIQTSFTYQNLPGISVSANLSATNAQIAPSLGRNLSAGATATASVALIEPESVFEDRLNQFDVRFTKILRVGGSKIQGMFDIYNLFNASTILGVNTTYGSQWLRPTSILGARLVKVGAQIDW